GIIGAKSRNGATRIEAGSEREPAARRKPGGYGLHSFLAEPDGRAQAGAEVARGVAVDDSDLDPAGAAGQGDERAGGLVAIGPAEPRGTLPGDLDRPGFRRGRGEMLAANVGDQVAE